jgi:two-component system invasion response regulator UvrY
MPARTEHAAPATVLIVDDHTAIRAGLRAALLDSTEFRVVDEAANAEQALDHVRKAAPEIVIMDVSLPGRSGIEAAQDIRDLCPSTKIVAYTMYAESGFVAGMMKAGASAYVLKGEPLGSFLDALRMARDGKTRVPDSLAEWTSVAPGRPEQDSPKTNGISALSRREREVFLRLANGQSVKQAAFELNLSPKTVETYKYRLMRKLNVASVIDLAKIAIRAHLVSA